MNLHSLFGKTIGKNLKTNVVPPVLVSPERVPYGAFKFKTQLPLGSHYDIQATTNLKNWTSINTGITSESELAYVDSNASNFSYRFYRLISEGISSTNIIGFISITLPPGFSMIANPLEMPANTIGDLLCDMPDGTSLSKFNAQLSKLTENKVKNGVWASPADRLAVGEGALLFNPTSDYKVINFAGSVRQGNFVIPIPASFSIRSSMIPQPGDLQSDLGFPITDGDVVHLFDRDSQKYVLYPYGTNGWTSRRPVIGVGESFWIAKKTAKNWLQSFFDSPQGLTSEKP